jgi:glycosyltransferase involved in cell wall biosynthesis
MKKHILTICIPTIDGREEKYEALRDFVKSQTQDKGVSIISLKDNKSMSIGTKRRAMLDAAQGEYVVMIDDDDWVANDYVDSILAALESKPDFVGFNISCEGTDGKTANVSNKYSDWADKKDGYDYVRTPYHKTPIKTSIARQINFKDLRWGEDYDFSKRLKQSGLIKTEVHIDKVLYFYRYKYEDHRTKYGFDKDGR